ncbi:MAG: type II secretion system protein N [Gammaproteobacteria bacterium]|nr:type II secretion system protein N [Gammaproteobacteria bacterium]MCF6229644.1 type II secretion system protein N [Gammaproteobacteria bacterium]
MKSKIAYALLFFGVYLLSLWVILPATYVASILEEQVDGLMLYGVEGTLWSGEMRALEVEGVVLENVEWSLSPWPLLLGNAQLNITSISDGLQGRGVVEIDLLSHEVTLYDSVVKLPVERYAAPLGLADFDLTGEFELNLNQLRYQQGVIYDLSGVLIWHQAGISGALVLGALQAEFTQQDGALEAVLSDREGPVKLDGELSLQSSGHYQFKSRLGARDESDLSLKQTLRLIGRTIDENRVEVKTTGSVTLPAWLILG